MNPLEIHNIYLILELTSFVAACIRYLMTRDRISGRFVILLFLTNVVEWGNFFRLIPSFRASNNWTFNLFNPIEFGFYVWLFHDLFMDKLHKRKVVRLYIGLVAAVLLNIFFVQDIRYIDSYTFMLGSLLMLYCVYLYFSQIMDHVDNQSILKKRFFWVSIGLLFFYAGEFFLLAFFEYFLRMNDFLSFRPTFQFFNNILNIILYSCLSISFLCRPMPPGR